MHGRIENQANNGHTDNGQQNAAWDCQFFQTNNHRQANQGHDHREAGEVTQRHRQTVQRVLNDQTHAIGGNQQQEQTDTDTGAVCYAVRQVAQNPATNAGCRDNGEQHAHQEDGSQGNRYADVLAQHQAKRGEGGQGNGTANRHRQIRPQPHYDGANTGDKTGCNENRCRWESCFTEHARHNDDGVHHCQKRCQTGNDFLAHGAAESRNFKDGVK